MMPRLILLALTLSLAAAAARAAVVGGTIAGTIAGNTYDSYGLFGTPGRALSGRSVTATYSYDTASASYSGQSGSDAWLGAGYLSLSVTIGGVTLAPVGTTLSLVVDAADGADTEIILANFAPAPLLDFVLFATGSWVPGVTIDGPFSLDTSYYQQTIYVSADGSHYDTLNFVGSSENFVASPEPAEPVPEPAPLAWFGVALAILGRLRRGR